MNPAYLSILLGVLALTGAGILIIRGYNAKGILFSIGITLMILAYALGQDITKTPGGDPVADLTNHIYGLFENRGGGLGMIIMILIGFSAYMSHIGANDVVIRVLYKPLRHIRSPYILLAGGFLLGALMSLAINSATALGVFLMATLFPIMVRLGISGTRTAEAEGREARGTALADNISATNAAWNAAHAWRSGQSGIYAGKDGYHIENTGTVDLQGGVILSAAEREKNYLKTDHFTYSDVEDFATGKVKSANPGFAASFGRDQTSEADKKLNEKYRTGADGKVHNEEYKQANPNKDNSFVKFGINNGDTHSSDRYAASKILGSNLLGLGREKRNERGYSRAVISDGVFEVGSAEGRQNLATISKFNLDDYQAAHKPVMPVDIQALKNKLNEDIHRRKDMLFDDFAVSGMDAVYRSQAIDEHRMMTFETDANGKPIEDPERLDKIREEAKNKEIKYEDYRQQLENAGVNFYKLREVKDSERANLGKATFIDPQSGQPVQKHFVAFNGIFNDLQAAAKYATQNYVAIKDKDGNLNQKVYKNIYFVHNPTADSTLGELFVAGYQKMFESGAGGFFGLGNSTIQARDLMKQYGKDDLYLGLHSRGTFTGHNAMNDLLRDPDNIGVLSGTEIKMVGPATHVANADRQYVKLQGDASNPHHIKIENNSHDFVGSNIGGNPKTMSNKPEDKGFWGVVGDIFGSDASAHNCYGLGNPICRKAGYRDAKDDEMHPATPVNKLKPHKYWDMIYWQNYLLPSVYQPEENNNGVNP